MKYLLGCALATSAACGSSTPTPMIDAAGSAASTITISGKATAQGLSPMALAGVTIGAYQSSNEATPVATTTTDQMGNYSLVLTTGGQAVDGYLKATIANYLDTYLYPPAVLAADFSNASINMVNRSTLDLLTSTLCGNQVLTTDGVIAVEVVDAAGTTVAGAMVASTPASTAYCYNAGSPSLPNKNATMTDSDGIAYMLKVSGSTTVSSTKTGLTFGSHVVNARVGAFTTTLITAQ